MPTRRRVKKPPLYQISLRVLLFYCQIVIVIFLVLCIGLSIFIGHGRVLIAVSGASTKRTTCSTSKFLKVSWELSGEALTTNITTLDPIFLHSSEQVIFFMTDKNKLAKNLTTPPPPPQLAPLHPLTPLLPQPTSPMYEITSWRSSTSIFILIVRQSLTNSR